MNLIEVKISDITYDKRHYRNSRLENDDGIAELMADIKNNGLLQPVGLAPTSNGKYVPVYGNRRIEAVKKLGHKYISAVLVDDLKDEKDYLFKNFSENDQRKNLSVYEQGRFFQLLKDEGLTVEEIAARVGKSRMHIARMIETGSAIPPEFRSKVVTKSSGRGKKPGTIPHSIFRAVRQVATNRNLQQDKFRKILAAAESGCWNTGRVRQVGNLIANGLSTEQAIKNGDEYKTISVSRVVSIATMKKIEKKTGMTIQKYFRFVLDNCLKVQGNS